MGTKIVDLAEKFVIGQWAAVIGGYTYELTRVYLDYRLLDKESPGYMWKNGLLVKIGKDGIKIK